MIININHIINKLKSILPAQETYLVGGFIRDILLKRPTRDIDIIITHNTRKYATLIAKKFSSHVVVLDELNRIYRIPVKLNSVIVNVDLSQTLGKDIYTDLLRRDFTINTLCIPLTSYQPQKIYLKCATTLPIKETIIDIGGGIKDLRNKIVRMTHHRVFIEDPLRLLRAYRLCAELDFKLSEETKKAIKKYSAMIALSAKERLRDELLKILACKKSYETIVQMDKQGLLSQIIPEISDMKKSAKKFYFHPEGLWQHSKETLKGLEKLLFNLKAHFGILSTKIEKDISSRISLLKFVALLHDIGKPETAKYISGRIRFFGHEKKGSKKIKLIMRRLRFSKPEIKISQIIIDNHMRPGNFSALKHITDKAIFRFFRDLGNYGVDLLLLSLADRYSYLHIHRNHNEIKQHEKAIKLILKKYYQERERVIPPKLVDGYTVMKICKIKPGPLVGKLLNLVQEKQSEGKITTYEEAIEFLKRAHWQKANLIG